MHAHAGSLLSLLDVRACVCVRESAARLCNRVGGSEEQLRVAAELPPSLFPSLPRLFPSLFVSTRDEGCTHRVVLLEVWGFFFFELVVWRILECCCRLCECLRVFFLGVRRREMR